MPSVAVNCAGSKWHSMNSHSPDVTTLLRERNSGDTESESLLYGLVYQELRRRAAAIFRGRGHGQMLTPTSLVHEAYLRLTTQADRTWASRQDFFRYAARVMRNVLVDHARAELSDKRGGGHVQALTGESRVIDGRPSALDPVIDIDYALTALQELSPRQAEIVTMQYFGGMTAAEVAEVLGISKSTVDREWRLARAWLLQKLT